MRFRWFIYIFFPILFISQQLKGQIWDKNKMSNYNNNRADSLFLTLIKNKDTLLNQFLDIGIIEKIQSDAIAAVKKSKSLDLFNKLDNTLKKNQFLKDVYQSTMLSSSYYVTNRTDSLSKENDFANVVARFNLKVFDIPFSVHTSLIMESGRLRTDFSYTNIQFNIEDYKKSIQQKVSINLLKDYFRSNTMLKDFQLTRIDSATLINDLKFEAYNSIVSNPRLQALKYEIHKEIDSITNKTDSLLRYKYQSYMDSLNYLKDNIEKIEKQYELLWDKRKETYKQIENLKERLETANEDIKRLTDINYLKSKASQIKNIGIKDKLMLNTKGLDIGQFGADEDDFTIKSQLLNGVRYEYESKKNELGVLIGTSRLRGIDMPLYYNPFQKTLLGRQFVHIKYGYKTSDSSRIIFRILNVHKTQDSILKGQTSAEYNTVIGLTYEKTLLKRVALKSDCAYSSLRGSFLSNPEKEERSQLGDIALSSSIFWNTKQGFKLGIGYFYIGRSYITYGNDFLLNNRNGLQLDLSANTLNNRLKAKFGFKAGFLNDPSVLGLKKSVVYQMIGELNWFLTKQSYIQAQYSPNTITQLYGHTDSVKQYDYKTNMYVISGLFNYKIGGNRQITLVAISNINQQVDYFDSLKVTNTLYSNIRHEYHITDKSNIVLNSNIGLGEGLSQIRTGLLQTDIRLQIHKRCKVAAGLQIIKKTIEPVWKGGLVSNINMLLGKISLKVGLIYRKPLISYNSIKDEWIANSAISLIF